MIILYPGTVFLVRAYAQVVVINKWYKVEAIVTIVVIINERGNLSVENTNRHDDRLIL